MKILQVIHGFPPYYMAGSEVYTYNLCQELNKENDVYVFSRIENPYDSPYSYYDEEYRGLKVRRVNKPQRDYSLTDKYLDEQMDKIFLEYLDDVDPDVVHFGHLSHLSTNSVNVAKERGYPMVYTLHDFWLKCYRGQLINTYGEICSDPSLDNCFRCVRDTFGEKWVKNDVSQYMVHMDKVIDNIDVFLTPSLFLKKFFVENGVPSDKIIYSKYGFNKEIIKRKKKSYNKDSKISFGFMGRVIPVKGIELLLKAFSSLEKGELRIYGSVGKELKFLKKYMGDNVVLEGRFDNWEIDHVLSKIDVLVVPSIWYENSPLVIQEAFLAGIPVITSDIGGMAELVEDGKDGFTFEVGDVEALKKLMNRIVEDPEVLNGLDVSDEKVRSIQEDAKFVMSVYREVAANE